MKLKIDNRNKQLLGLSQISPGSYEQCRALLDQFNRTGTLTATFQPNLAKLEKDMHWLQEKPHRHILCLYDADYPDSLRQLAKPPLILFAEGSLSALSYTPLAIIGSRKPTAYGLSVTQSFGQALSREGICIVSGLALGIDGQAHRAALEAHGPTIAVLGSGLNRLYPATHHHLAQAIINKGGLLLSEYPLDSPPLPFHFPQRNRIISGLSLGVFIVEAGMRSGSFSTANHALEQGRDVFAVPGPITQSSSEGCHQLIQSGAKLVCKLSDILEELPNFNHRQQTPRSQDMGLSESPLLAKYPLLQYINYECTNIDSLLEKTGWPMARLSASLLELELEGYIAPIAGGYKRSKVA